MAQNKLFDWCSISALSATTAHDETSTLELKLEQQKDTIAQLTAQLEQLVQAKQEHESALLEKFKLLLNAKKLKIRDQQRLLAGAHVNKNEGRCT